jgi:hypothetical protein
VRSKAVELIGELISLPGVPILESFQPLFSEFLKRLTDRVVDLRISVIEHLKNCLISHPSRPEASQIIRTFFSFTSSFSLIACEAYFDLFLQVKEVFFF